MALVMIAGQQHMFKNHGVNVRLSEFTAGKFALQAFLGGSLDVAVAGDVPTELALLQGQHFKIIGEVLADSHAEVRMIVRHRGGCAGITPETFFVGHQRKIATSFGGGPQYFTAKFLAAHNISPEQVRLISQKPEEMPAAIVSKAVDGISIFDPAASTAEEQLGQDECTFPDPGTYRQHYIVIARDDEVMPPGSARLRAFLAALKEVAAFTSTNLIQAQEIVGTTTGLGAGRVAAIWPHYTFGIVLSPTLGQLLSEEADWDRQQAGQATSLAHPDYGQVIDASLLR